MTLSFSHCCRSIKLSLNFRQNTGTGFSLRDIDMAKTKSRARKRTKSRHGTVAPSQVNGQTLGSKSVTLEWGFSLKKKNRKDLKKKIRMEEQDKLETAGKMPVEKWRMEELVKLLAGHKLDGVEDRSCHERKGTQSGREFIRSLRELQVWEVGRFKPGQIMVACPVCKLEKLHESSVNCFQEFKNLRNHFKREHKRLKFYLVRSRCLKCPICLEIVSASQLGVHFRRGRPCEKNIPVDQNKVSFKEEGSEKDPGGSGAGTV